MDRCLRAERAVDPLRLRLTGDVDDAPPFVGDHRSEQPVRELPVPREVEGERLLPLRFVYILAEGPATAGIVHEDLDRSEWSERGGRHSFDIALVHGIVR